MIRIRRTVRTITRAVRSVVAPASLMVEHTPVAPEPTDLYSTDDMPAAETIEAAAAQYATAADMARQADRAKRKSRKVIGRLPAGRYGAWLVERKHSSRMTADLDSIRATYARLGLGPVPMKASAPSLVVTRAATTVPVTVTARPATADTLAA